MYKGNHGKTEIVAKALQAKHMQEGFGEFQSEVQVMSRLDHVNDVVRLFGIMLNPLRMVMEYCPMGDVGRALAGLHLLRRISQLLNSSIQQVPMDYTFSQLSEDECKSLLKWCAMYELKTEGREWKFHSADDLDRLKGFSVGQLLTKLRTTRDIAIFMCDERVRIRMCLDIARGMQYMHSRNPPLAHRDLRSPNVFLVSIDPESECCAKVADFGLTVCVTERLGQGLPTWQWMAPEAQRGEAYTEKCDSGLYSFGIVVYEMYSAELPFLEYADMKYQILLQQIINGDLRPTLPQHTPDDIKAMVMRLWSADPNKRPSFADCVSIISGESMDEDGDASNDNNNIVSRKRNKGLFRSLYSFDGSSITCMERGSDDGCIWIAMSDGSIHKLTPSGEVYGIGRDTSTVHGMCWMGECMWSGRKDGRMLKWGEKRHSFNLGKLKLKRSSDNSSSSPSSSLKKKLSFPPKKKKGKEEERKRGSSRSKPSKREGERERERDEFTENTINFIIFTHAIIYPALHLYTFHPINLSHPSIHPSIHPSTLHPSISTHAHSQGNVGDDGVEKVALVRRKDDDKLYGKEREREKRVEEKDNSVHL